MTEDPDCDALKQIFTHLVVPAGKLLRLKIILTVLIGKDNEGAEILSIRPENFPDPLQLSYERILK